MTRTTALAGLVLSLLLHAGLLLIGDGPVDRLPGHDRLEVSLRPIAVRDTAGVTPAEAPPPVRPEPSPSVRPPAEPSEAPPPAPPVSSRSEPAAPDRVAPTAGRAEAEKPLRPAARPTQPAQPRPVTSKREAPADPADDRPTVEAAAAPRVEPEANPQQAGPEGTAEEPDTGAVSPPRDEPGEIVPPVYIPTTRPYPSLARERGWEGTVELQVDIARDGRVTGVKVHASSGYPVLDRAATRQVRSARFRPALRDGQPIAFTARLPVVFELK